MLINKKNHFYTIPKTKNFILNFNWSFLKKGNFKPGSITANIEKTCFLNLQIKHYYYKSGRFDRFLISLLKINKPSINFNDGPSPLFIESEISLCNDQKNLSFFQCQEDLVNPMDQKSISKTLRKDSFFALLQDNYRDKSQDSHYFFQDPPVGYILKNQVGYPQNFNENLGIYQVNSLQTNFLSLSPYFLKKKPYLLLNYK